MYLKKYNQNSLSIILPEDGNRSSFVNVVFLENIGR
jgi:hypothetical protein